MSQHVRIQHMPLKVPAASTNLRITSSAIGGFFCTTAGSVTISYNDDQGTTQTLLTFAASANTWYPLPFYIGYNGGFITTDTTVGVLAT